MIESDRLTMRPLTMDDCTDRYVEWLNDAEVIRYLETRHSPQDKESIKSFVSMVNKKDNEYLYGIFLKDGLHIGNIKIGPIHSFHKTGDMSMFIGDKKQWGKGFGAEAVAKFSIYCFETFDIDKISASMYRSNLGSTNAFLKAGFSKEGLRISHLRLSESDRDDMVELGLLRPPRD